MTVTKNRGFSPRVNWLLGIEHRKFWHGRTWLLHLGYGAWYWYRPYWDAQARLERSAKKFEEDYFDL
jgi:hypothetical protein